MSAAERFINGTDTAADRERLRQALLCWISDTEQGPTLQARLGITRQSLRAELRRPWIQRAARLIRVAGDDWKRASAIRQAIRAHAIRRFEHWRRNGIPASATDLERALHQALLIDPAVRSTRTYWNDLK